jgi:GNAT superfamily N-acetyltransferase|tara:strand:- start:436 stop:906 length:471 start_codon:yes stop_codon:yes gene_type:complete
MQSTNGFNYSREDFYKVKEEVDELFYKHWEEIALNKDKIKLNPDWSFYEALYTSGNLGVYTVRKDEQLVGYFIVVARPHPHYKDHLFAVNDIIYIDPKYRKGLVGFKLIKFVEQDLKKMGVSVLAVNTKVHKPFDAVLERLGFENTERLYTKYIGE